MIRVSSAEFADNMPYYQDAAFKEPVIVTRDGDDRTVMMSIGEYRRLKQLDHETLPFNDVVLPNSEQRQRADADARMGSDRNATHGRRPLETADDRIMTSVRLAQSIVREFSANSNSLADELIAERRVAASRE